MPLAPGAQIGPFTVLSLLGKGGMGEVYRARDSKLGRDVALKILPAALLHDPERSARFSREARLLASLDHPNIGAIYGLEEAEGVRALVLALVEGPTLAERIKAGPLPIEEATAIARQIAEAVEYAHDRGVIHRDLKPANVKITPEGVVKVLDFGLAKALTDEAAPADPEGATLTMGSTEAGLIMGTAAYMSPEQAKGLKTDRRSDIWSFGVLFYEMLTGKRLFTGQTAADILAGVIKEEKNLGAVPAPYRPLIARCIHKDARRRLQAIGEARIILDAGGESALAAPPGAPPTPPRATRAWAVAALLAFTTGLAWWAPWRAADDTRQPPLRLSVDLGPNALIGINITAAISPDGKRLVYPTKGPGGLTQLALRLLDQSGETMLPGTGNASEPFFSPDGQWIAFFAEGKLKKVSVQGGAPIILADASNSRGGTWSEDGTIVAALSNVAGLEAVSSDGAARSVLTRLEKGEATHRWPHALPGGENVLFTNSGNIDFYDQASIEVVNLKTGARSKVWQGGYYSHYAAGRLLYLLGHTLFGVPFDPAGLRVLGSPVPLLADVGNNSSTGGGQYDIAAGAGILAYYSGRPIEGWLVSWLEEGKTPTPLLADPQTYYEPRFSHDGSRLAVVGPETDIYLSDAARGAFTRVTFSPQDSYSSPAWTPDDKHIAVRAQVGSGSRIGWIRATGGDPVFLTEAAAETRPLDFSKDGKRLIYSQVTSQTNFDLWILPLDLTDPDHPKPGKPELYLGSQYVENAAATSPDGNWIAYHSNEIGGRNEVFVRPFPLAGRAPSGLRWQVSTGGGQWPRWSANGRDLYYMALPADNRIIAAAYTAQGGQFFPGKVRPFAEARVVDNGYPPFDAHPDGKRLAIVSGSVSAASQQLSGNVHVTFLVNFFDELRRQVPVK